jgi:Ser/Thr protein kinase RdoA (MazF antagonist)
LKVALRDLDEIQVPTFLTQLERLADNPVAPLSNPSALTKKRGHPLGALSDVTKRRDKSLYEYVEGRKCGKCGKTAHNSRTCSE